MSQDRDQTQRILQYLAEHKVQERLEHAANSLATNLPQDPFGFILHEIAKFAKPPLISKLEGRSALGADGQSSVEASVFVSFRGQDTLLGVQASASLPAPEHSIDPLEAADDTQAAAAEAISSVLSDALKGLDVMNQFAVDAALSAESAELKSAPINAINAVSQAVAVAASAAGCKPLYSHIRSLHDSNSSRPYVMPLPVVTILSGGRGSSLPIDGISIVPPREHSYSQMLKTCSRVLRGVERVLSDSHGSSLVTLSKCSDRGLTAPTDKIEDALKLVVKAISDDGPAKQPSLALHCNATLLYDADNKVYDLSSTAVGKAGAKAKKKAKGKSAGEMCDYWFKLCSDFPIRLLDDPLSKHDTEGWSLLRSKFDASEHHKTVALLGGAADSGASWTDVTVRSSSAATLSQSLHLIDQFRAESKGCCVMVSSGPNESESTFVADLAVAVGATYVHFGSLYGAHNTSKYNRCVRIQEELEVNGLLDVETDAKGKAVA